MENKKKNSNSLIEEYEIDLNATREDDVNDYDFFKDKNLLDKIRKEIIQNVIDNNIPGSEIFEDYINNQIDKSLTGYDLSNLERSHIFNMIDNEINGYGPITELLNDQNISEIMVNGPDEVYVEIDGKLMRDRSVSFINDNHILRVIQRMVQPLGKTIDVTNPMVDSRLPDGSRVNAIIPPLSLNGPVITIRKFRENLNNINDLLSNGTLTNEMALFLEACVKAKMNIIVCGGTGSGKTTILNVLSNFIGESERIITIEDAAELKLKGNHIISLETRNTNYDANSEITIRDLVRNSLRMRPDRIIVGEVRGKEAFDMLQAMNTGHEGSLTTLHANGDMEIPVRAIREYIKNALDIIVTTSRLSDGRRKVTSISEIIGMKDGEIELREIFSFHQNGVTSNNEVDGYFVKCNGIPKVYEKLVERGVKTLEGVFSKKNINRE